MLTHDDKTEPITPSQIYAFLKSAWLSRRSQHEFSEKRWKGVK
jgi:hypothetical protein